MYDVNVHYETAGAFIYQNGYFPFMFGPDNAQTAHGVVRLGGHREPHEDAWACAFREIVEEAQMTTSFLDAPLTYYMENEQATPIVYDHPIHADIQPLLLAGNLAAPQSVMFLGSALEEPSPSSETRGILRLSPRDIQAMCERPVTLREFRYQADARQILQVIPLDEDLVLRPYLQLRFLHFLLTERQDLFAELIDALNRQGSPVRNPLGNME